MMMKKTLVKRRTAEKMTANKNSLGWGDHSANALFLRQFQRCVRPPRRRLNFDGEATSQGSESADHASPDILKIF